MFKILVGLSLSVITLSGSAAQNIIEWTGKEESLNIADQVLYFEDSEDQFSINEVASLEFREQFAPFNNRILNFGNSSHYWLKFNLNRVLQEENVLLVMAQAALADVSLFYQDEKSGEWQEYKSGFNLPIDEKKFKHPFQIFTLPKQSKEYYVRFQPIGLAVPLELWEENSYELKTVKHQINFGIFSGMMLFVIVINLFFFFSLHKVAYLHYAILVLLYYIIAANVEGYFLYLFPNADLVYGLNFYAILTMPIGLSYVLYFLEAKKYVPRFYFLAWWVIVFYTTSLIWHIFLSPLNFYYVATAMGLTTVLLMLIGAAVIARSGNKMGYYFFGGYLLFFLVAIVDSINRFTGVPPYIFEISYISIAFMIEAFVLSYLLSKRFQWEKEEDQEAKEASQLKLLEQTQENERIVKEQNILLEERVIERTTQLQDLNKELSNLLDTVRVEQEKSDSLLLNILPSTTARELKELGVAKPQTYQIVSVIFTDFKNFTSTTASMPPETIVNDLNECFSQFDTIVQKYGIEKIKTIGDAYMAAGGIPIPTALHALDTVRAALEIKSFMNSWNSKRRDSGLPELEIRIGIHSGPVVAGVVGTHKFAYDIWGDTVNTASRMESFGEPGKVNVSEKTYDLVKDKFNCTPRESMEVAGKGQLNMYWIDDEKVPN